MKYVISLTTFTPQLFLDSPLSHSQQTLRTQYLIHRDAEKDSYLLALAITLGDPNEAYLVCGIVMNRRGSSILTL